MENEDKAVPENCCVWCGKRGGRVQLDPYRLDLYDERVYVRLHDKCATERAYEI